MSARKKINPLPKSAKKYFKKNIKEKDKLTSYVDKEIYFTGKVASKSEVVSLGYIGKSYLIVDITVSLNKDMRSSDNVSHLWIHSKEFNKLPVNKFFAKGIVYPYSKDYRTGKILYTKYSIKNIAIIDNDITEKENKGSLIPTGKPVGLR